MKHPISSTALVRTTRPQQAVPPNLDGQAVRVRTSSGPGDGGEPPALRRNFTPGMMLQAVRRRWIEATALGLVLAAIAGVAAWMLKPDKYTSFAILQIQSAEQRILKDTTNPNFASTTYMRTQLTLLKGRPVLKAALDNKAVSQLPTLAKQADPLEWLEKELRVDHLDGTDLVRISLTVPEAGNDIPNIVNAVINAYLEEVVSRETATDKARLNDLQNVYGVAEEKLRVSRDALNSLLRTLKEGDDQIWNSRKQLLLEEYAAATRDIRKVKESISKLDNKIAMYRLRQDPANPMPDEINGSFEILIEKELESDSIVRAKELEIANLNEMLRGYKDKQVGDSQAARIQSLERQIQSAKNDLQAIREERRAEIKNRYAASNQASMAVMLREAEAERVRLQNELTEVQNEANKRNAELREFGVNSTDLESKRSEVEQGEKMLRMIWEQKERIELEMKGSARQRVYVHSAADEPTILNKYGRIQAAATAAMFGLLAGLSFIGFLELRRGLIYRPQDITKGLRLRVVGTLPKLQDAKNQQKNSNLTPEGRYGGNELVESIDSIRTMIMNEHQPGTCAVFMVASANPSEGKTTLATHLSGSFARAGCRTLLIDADLRLPRIHTMFQMPRSPGISDILQQLSQGGNPLFAEDSATIVHSVGQPTLDDAIRATPFEHLHFLPAGEFTTQAAAGLAQPATLHRLFDSLRSRYDFIIIDSSPMLLLPDALMLARCSDGLIYSARPGVSQTSEIYAAYQRLRESRLPFFGVVVNGIASNKPYVYSYGKQAHSPAPPTQAAS